MGSFRTELTVVGANGYGASSGRGYLYLGGPSPNNISDVVLSGEETLGNFGYSISSAGDINGDGLSDVISGAYGFSSNTGKAYIYLSLSPQNILPNIIFAKDVLYDQGGKVQVKWFKCAYDVPSINTITEYEILRSFPPIGGNYAWQSIANVPAGYLSFYSYVANTPYDSNSSNNGILYYRVKAKTSNSTVYYLSNIMPGYSVDNIPPLAVSAFTTSIVSNQININWNKNQEADLFNYLLFRKESLDLSPNIDTPFASIIDTSYIDASPNVGNYYYFIVAQDVHNNKSPLSFVEKPNISINLKIYLEACYDSLMNVQVSDTIKLYLHNATSPFLIVDSASSFVNPDGTVQLKCGNANSGTYYIAVKFRNSIETWSRSGGEQLQRMAVSSYDFSDQLAKAFGENMVQIDSNPVRFGLYSGDVNQDKIIDLTDVISIYNKSILFITGSFIQEDLNGDKIVDISDISTCYNNTRKFIGSILP